MFEGGVGERTPVALVEVHGCSKEINPLNGHAVGILHGDGERLHLHTQVKIVGVLAGRRLVVQDIVRVVEPPLTVLVDEVSLAFEEVGVMLVLPTHPGAVVRKRSVAGVPVRDEAAVGAERTEVHDRNRSHGVKPRGVHGLVQTGVNARFGPSVGQPALGVGVVRARQRAFRPVGTVEHGLVGKLSVGPASWHLFFVSQKQLPTVNGERDFLDAIGAREAP